jgi:hypothetical protein
MVLECWVIIIILGIAAYMFVRSNKKTWAGCVFPLMLVPLLNIIYAPIGSHIAIDRPLMSGVIRIIIYIVSFIAASCWVIAFARILPKGRSRYAYVTSSILFTAILIVIFIVKISML